MAIGYGVQITPASSIATLTADRHDTFGSLQTLATLCDLTDLECYDLCGMATNMTATYASIPRLRNVYWWQAGGRRPGSSSPPRIAGDGASVHSQRDEAVSCIPFMGWFEEWRPSDRLWRRTGTHIRFTVQHILKLSHVALSLYSARLVGFMFRT